MHATHGCTELLPRPEPIGADIPVCCINLALEAELHAGEILIRRFSPDDANQLFEAVQESVEELCSWMVWCRPDYAQEECAAFVERCAADWNNGRQFSFAIIDSRDGAFLGSVGLNSVNATHRFANLGYWVRSSQTGRGIASRSVRLLTRLAFETAGFERLEILVPVGNVPSQRVAEKCGAKFEGILRNRVLLNGTSQDALMYSLVREDLP